MNRRSFVKHYRTQDEREDYTFSFEEQGDGSWLAFIIDSPEYGRRSEGLHETHRLTQDGRNYVCWDRPLNDPRDCMEVAARWADCTQEYIRSGKRF